MTERASLTSRVWSRMPQLLPVAVSDLQAVLFEQRYDVVVEVNEPFAEDVADLGLPDFEPAHRVEVDFVDGAAGGEESDEHRSRMDKTIRMPRRGGVQKRRAYGIPP